jgi:uncharacterized protein (TIGR03382 family)
MYVTALTGVKPRGGVPDDFCDPAGPVAAAAPHTGTRGDDEADPKWVRGRRSQPVQGGRMFRRKNTMQQVSEDLSEAARTTHPAVPVAGAMGFALLGAALVRRRRAKAAQRPTAP